MRRAFEGQSLIIVAIFALTLFIFIGLAIDGSMLYLGRRHLQNVADAACLAGATELSLGGTETTATAAANSYIQANMSLSETRLAFDLPATIDFTSPTGTGQGLTRGIEVTGADVRVAISFPAATFFLRIARIQSYQVSARAHCSPSKGGGIWPIAVVRFPGYDENDNRVGKVDTQLPLPQNFGNGPSDRYLKVRDVLQAQDAFDTNGVINDGPVSGTSCDTSRRNWFDWPSLGDPVARSGPFRRRCSSTSEASPTHPGYEVALTGTEARANTGGSFRGAVLLDMRQLGYPDPNLYNGQTITSSPNSQKQSIKKYLTGQYPGPDVQPGEQLAVINGVSAGIIISMIRDRYKVGDVVTTLMYDGRVYKQGDFTIAVTCKQGTLNCSNTGTNKGKYVFRDDPGSPSSDCKVNGDGYIADGSAFSSELTNPASPPQPAQYIVQLAPERTSGGPARIRLSARLSGTLTGSAGGDGAPEDFGDLRVRWEWVDTTGTTQYAPSATGWQESSVAVDVDMPATGLNVTLKVIQSKTEKCLMVLTPLTTTLEVNLPSRVAGAQTIEVLARSVSAGSETRQHFDYAVLGMRTYSGDYYLSAANDPGTLMMTRNSLSTLKRTLQTIDAVTANNRTWSSIPPYTVQWKGDLAPGGVSTNVSLSGGKLVLEVTGTPATAGDFDLDLEIQSPRVHSTRFHLRVESDAASTIDEWIVNLCYANFRLTRMDSNEVFGRAITGCLRPDEIARGLISRQLSW